MRKRSNEQQKQDNQKLIDENENLKKTNEQQKQDLAKQAPKTIPTLANQNLKANPQYFDDVSSNLINMPERLKPTLRAYLDKEAMCEQTDPVTYDIYYHKNGMFLRKKLTKEAWENRANDPLLKTLNFTTVPV